MSNWIIGTETFKDSLDSWLFRADQASAQFLADNKSMIPPVFQSYTKKLYRGMVVDRAFIEQINNGGVILEGSSSWSKDINMAKKFVMDHKYSIANKNGISIVIEKVIDCNQQILDIDAFVSFNGVDSLIDLGFDEMNLDSAMNEKEVLVAGGVVIVQNDVKLIG